MCIRQRAPQSIPSPSTCQRVAPSRWRPPPPRIPRGSGMMIPPSLPVHSPVGLHVLPITTCHSNTHRSIFHWYNRDATQGSRSISTMQARTLSSSVHVKAAPRVSRRVVCSAGASGAKVRILPSQRRMCAVMAVMAVVMAVDVPASIIGHQRSSLSLSSSLSCANKALTRGHRTALVVV